jgi:amicyanin
MMGGQYNHGPMMGGQYNHGSMMGGGSGTSAQGQGTQGTQGAPAVGTTQVQMANFAFTPAYIQVKAGTTVMWTNQDAAPHTVTFRSGMMHSSAMMQQGQTFRYTFTTPGMYTYYCAVHPNMTAQVVVTP